MESRPETHALCTISLQLWLLFHAVVTCAQTIPPFKFTSYTTAQGLPTSEVNAFSDDETGFLWVATSDGISRFDGVFFKNYRMPVVDSTKISSNNKILKIQCWKNQVWCLSRAGYLFQFDHLKDAFVELGSCVTNSKPLEKKTVYEHFDFIYDTLHTCFWIKDMAGILRLDLISGKKQRILPLKDSRTGNLFFDDSGKIWCGGETGLTCFDPETGQKKRYFETIPFFKVICRNGSKIWAMPNPDTLCFLDVSTGDARIIKTNIPQSFKALLNDCIKQLAIVPGITGENLLWLITCGNGILILDIRTGQYVAHFTTDSEDSHGLSHDMLNAAFTGRDGSFWIATRKGIQKVDNRQHHFFTKSIPILKVRQNCRLRQVLTRFGHTEEKWIATCRGLFLIDTRQTKVLEAFLKPDHDGDTERMWSDINAIATDENGTLLAAVMGGLVKIDSSLRLKKFPGKDVGIKNVIEMIPSEKNTVWIRTFPGAGLLLPEQRLYYPIRFPKRQDGTDAQIYKLKSGLANSILLCQDSAIWRVRSTDFDASCKCYPKPELVLKIPWPTDVVETDTSLWIVLSNGLAEFHKTTGRIRHFGAAEGLTNFRIRSLLQGPESQLWMNSDNGIFAFYPQYGRFKRYSEEDGLGENYVPGVLTYDGDALHAGFSYTYTSWSPGASLLKTNVKPCITDVFALDKRLPADFSGAEMPSVTVRHAQNILRFEFTCPDFYQSEKITFLYQLEGFDDKRRNAGTARSAVYTNLDGGRYSFRVWAINADGFLCDTPAVVMLRVIPPYYRTWWFYVLCIAAIGGVFYAIFRYREIQRIRREALRLRIARDLHDEVGSTLSAISILSQSPAGRKGGSNRQLDNIGDKARSALDSMSDIVWAVNPQNDAMDQVIARMAGFASETLESAGITPHFSIGAGVENLSLPLDKRKDFYLIIKEAVSNCARHSGASNAYISIKKENGQLVFELSDDGVGLPAATATPTRSAYSGGNGLKNMAARAAAIGAAFLVENGTNGGVLITLKIPL